MSRPLAPRAFCDADPRQLERHFLAALQTAMTATAVAGGARLPAILVVAPTQRLLERLAFIAVEELHALAGVHFLVHQGLASHLLRLCGEPPPRPLATAWLVQLFRPRLATVSGSLARYLEEQPSAVAPLLATFRDLRDAGVQSNELTKVAASLSTTGRATVELFARFEELLEALALQGCGDASAIPRRALATIGSPPPELVLHYGAYDLIGTHRELLRQLATTVRTELFIPTAASAASTRALLAALGASLDTTDLATVRAAATTSVTSAADPRAEIRYAVRRLLAWHHHDGVPFDEMALLVRSAGPYTTALAREAALCDLVPDASIALPLADRPAAAALATQLAVWREPDNRLLRRQVERSRPPAWGDHDHAQSAIAAATTHSARLAALAELAAPARDAALDARLATLTSEARELEERALLPPSVPLNATLELLRAALEEPAAPPTAEATGQLRLLDFHQARALPLRRAVVIGANDALLPHRVSEDFFLDDGDRRRLAEATGAPIPCKADAERDEALLCEVVRAAVSERLEITFARSVGDRDAAPSAWLARLAGTTQGAAAPIKTLPRHPMQELTALAEATALLHPREALLLAADADSDVAAELAAQLDRDDPQAIRRGLTQIAAIDRHDASDLTFDGRVGPLEDKPNWTPSEIEQLGSCPLQYFFAHELELREAIDPTTSGELAPAQLGTLFHRVLHELYRELLGNATPSTDAAQRAAEQRAAERLPALLEKALASKSFAGALLPALQRVRIPVWSAQLLAFVRGDLARMRTAAIQDGRFELPLHDAAIHLPGGPLPLELRLDRLLIDANGGEWIGDYKLAKPASLRGRASVLEAVRGGALQLPIYALARIDGGAKLVGAELLSLAADPEEESAAVALDLDKLGHNVASLRDTLATLVALRRAGDFPLQPEEAGQHGQCSRCDFRRACRHSHGATRDRARAAAPFARYYALAEKQLSEKRAADAPRPP